MAEPAASPPSFPPLPPTLILTSTKSYFSPSRTLDYLAALLEPSNNILPLPSSILFGLIPDHLTIYPCTTILNQHSSTTSPSSWPLYLGAQDCSPFPTYGAYTGFTSPTALSALGVRIVELGHAERRRYAAETNESTAAKAAAATSQGLIPLVCIGELAAPNLSGPISAAIGTAMRELKPQIDSLLNAVPTDAPVIFAYEPVWAIGAAKPAGVSYVGPVVQAIRDVIKSSKPDRTAETRVVYGGSAGPGLWSGSATDDGVGLGEFVDGMFLGRFAHEIEGVRKVVAEVREFVERKEGKRKAV